MVSSKPITSYFGPKGTSSTSMKSKRVQSENVRPAKKRKVDPTNNLASVAPSGKSTGNAERTGTAEAGAAARSRHQLSNRTKSLNKAGFSAASPSSSSSPSVSASSSRLQGTPAAKAAYATPKSLARNGDNKRRGNNTSIMIDLTGSPEPEPSKSLREAFDIQTPSPVRPPPTPTSLVPTRTAASTSALSSAAFSSTISRSIVPTWTPKRSSKRIAEIVPETPGSPVSSPSRKVASSDELPDLSQVPTSQTQIEVEINFAAYRRINTSSSAVSSVAKSKTSDEEIIPSSQSQDIDLPGDKLLETVSPRRKRAVREIEGARRTARQAEAAAAASTRSSSGTGEGTSREEDSSADGIMPSSQSQSDDDLFKPRRARPFEHPSIDSVDPDIVPSSQSQVEHDVSLLEGGMVASVSPRRKRVVREIEDSRRTAREVEAAEAAAAAAQQSPSSPLLGTGSANHIKKGDDINEVIPSSSQLQAENACSKLSDNLNWLDVEYKLKDPNMIHDTTAYQSLPYSNSKPDDFDDCSFANEDVDADITVQLNSDDVTINKRDVIAPIADADMQSLFETEELQDNLEEGERNQSRQEIEDRGEQERESTRVEPTSLRPPSNSQASSVTESDSEDEQWVQQAHNAPAMPRRRSSNSPLPSYSYQRGEEYSDDEGQTLPTASRSHSPLHPHASSFLSTQPPELEGTVHGTQSWQTDISAYSYPSDAVDFFEMLKEGP